MAEVDVNIEVDVDAVITGFYAEKNTDRAQVSTHVSGFNPDLLECPQCYQPELSLEDNLIVCRACCREYGGLIEESAEWSSFPGDQKGSDPNRCGSYNNPLLVESSYGGMIAYGQGAYVKRLKQLHLWNSMPSAERTLKQVFDRLTYNSLRHGLTTNIIEFSHRLFAEVSDNQIHNHQASRGDPREGLISACLYYACLEHDVGRSASEIAKICDLSEADVNRGLNLFYDSMKQSQLLNLNQLTLTSQDFIARYCCKLQLSESITDKIRQVIQLVTDRKWLSHNIPQALVCGCICFVVTAYRWPLTKHEIAQTCGLSVTTITKVYEKLLPYTPELCANF